MDANFNTKEALWHHELLVGKMKLANNFTFDDLLYAIEEYRQAPIDINPMPLPPDVYGAVRRSKDGSRYIVSFNDKLQERLVNRAILHELGHIARGDVDKIAKTNMVNGGIRDITCYQRRGQLYKPQEKAVQLTSSIWLEQIMSQEQLIYKRSNGIWIK